MRWIGVEGASTVLVAAEQPQPQQPQPQLPQQSLKPQGLLQPRQLLKPQDPLQPRQFLQPRGLLQPRQLLKPRELLQPEQPRQPEQPQLQQPRQPEQQLQQPEQPEQQPGQPEQPQQPEPSQLPCQPQPQQARDVLMEPSLLEQDETAIEAPYNEEKTTPYKRGDRVQLRPQALSPYGHTGTVRSVCGDKVELRFIEGRKRLFYMREILCLESPNGKRQRTMSLRGAHAADTNLRFEQAQL